MNVFTYVAVTNVAICLAIAVGIYITHTAWPLWGLIFIQTASSTSDDDDDDKDGDDE